MSDFVRASPVPVGADVGRLAAGEDGVGGIVVFVGGFLIGGGEREGAGGHEGSDEDGGEVHIWWSA